MDNDDLEKLFFDSFADEDDVFTDEWVSNYVESNLDELDVVYSGETNSDNPACGDESEVIYEISGKKHTFYFVADSTGGTRGPFLTLDESIEALGYSPSNFDLEFGPFDPDAEYPDPECPYCKGYCCEHFIATINNNDELEEGSLDDERVTTWATWIEEALTNGKKLGVMPIAVNSISSLNSLSQSSKTKSSNSPYSVNSYQCNELVKELLAKSGAVIKQREFLKGGYDLEHFTDFYAEDAAQMIEQCERLLQQWLELPASDKV